MSIEIVKEKKLERGQIKAIIFDFDGTISTLRYGWEEVMYKLMIDMIGDPDNKALQEEIKAFIDQSTGVQTIYQIQWLVEKIKEYNNTAEVQDQWWYKDEYNRRLMENIIDRIQKVESGEVPASNYIIKGAVEFVKAIYDKNVELFIASGTDNKDVVREVDTLGITKYFSLIKGAPERKVDCSKEAVINMIIEEKNLSGSEIAIIGDGKVEIGLGAENDSFTIGLASCEDKLFGVNPVKRDRLLKAGANIIVGDFLEKDELLTLLGLN